MALAWQGKGAHEGRDARKRASLRTAKSRFHGLVALPTLPPHHTSGLPLRKWGAMLFFFGLVELDLIVWDFYVEAVGEGSAGQRMLAAKLAIQMLASLVGSFNNAGHGDFPSRPVSKQLRLLLDAYCPFWKREGAEHSLSAGCCWRLGSGVWLPGAAASACNTSETRALRQVITPPRPLYPICRVRRFAELAYKQLRAWGHDALGVWGADCV